MQRWKSVSDVKALGIVHAATGQLKLKISELMSTTKKTWEEVPRGAVKALNSYPRDARNGSAPSEVRDNLQVSFMLLDDRAKNAKHSAALTRRRVAKLEGAGAFRAPRPGLQAGVSGQLDYMYHNPKQLRTIF